MGNNTESTPSPLPTMGEDTAGTIFSPEYSNDEIIMESYEKQHDIMGALNEIFNNGLYDKLLENMKDTQSATLDDDGNEIPFETYFAGINKGLEDTLGEIEDYISTNTGLKVKMVASPELQREVMEDVDVQDTVVLFDYFGGDEVGIEVLTKTSPNQYLSSEDGLIKF